MRVRFPKYLLELFLFSMLLGTIPVIILGIFSYDKASTMIQEKVNEGNMQVLKQVQMNVEQVLKSLDSSVVQFSNSALVRNTISRSIEPVDFQTVSELFRGLSSMQGLGLSIYNTYLYSVDRGWSISKDGFFNAPDMRKPQALLNIQNRTGEFWIGAEREVNLIRKIPSSAVNPSGYIIVTVPGYEIARLVSDGSRQGEIIILDNNYNPILRKGPTPYFETAADYVTSIKNSSLPSGYLNDVINGSEVGITYHKSEYNGWTYLNIVSLKEITKESGAIGYFTLLICMIIFIAVLAISFLGSRKIYHPIRKLYESVKKSNKSDAGNKWDDEIHFIGEHIHGQITAQYLMTKTILEQTEQLKLFFIQKLLQGKSSPEEIKNKLPFFESVNNWKWLCVFVVQIDTLEDSPYSKHDGDLLTFAINNVVSELISGENRLNTLVLEQFQVTLMGTAADNQVEAEKYFSSQVSLVHNEIKKHVKVKVSIGVSRPFQEIKDAANAFQESTDALKYKVRLGYEVIIHIQNVQPNSNLGFVFPEHLKNALLDAIKLADRENVYRTLHQFISEVFRQDLGLQEHQIFLSKLFIHLIDLAQGLGKSVPILNRQTNTLFEQLFRLERPNEIENWFKHSIIEPIVQLVEDQRHTQYVKISKQIVDMIENEYDTDLTLEICASRLYYHPSHISRIFHKEVGSTFKEYLAMYRLNSSKKILTETDMTISDISKMLRYNNPQNFIRHFRKIESTTPGQYREANRISGHTGKY